MVLLPAVRIEKHGFDLVLRMTPDQADRVSLLLHRLQAPYLRVELAKPGRPRTTGERSQNHAINGFCQQIAMATGVDFDTVKHAMKARAISRGYPFDTLSGEVVPWSEKRITTEQAALLIDTIQQFAAEEGIFLKEYHDEDSELSSSSPAV